MKRARKNTIHDSLESALEAVDVSKLDAYEQLEYNRLAKSSSKVDALKILINSVEGDISQLSQQLEKIVIDFPADFMYAEGGGVKGPQSNDYGAKEFMDNLKKGSTVNLFGDDYVVVDFEIDKSQGFEEQKIILKDARGEIKSYSLETLLAHSKFGNKHSKRGRLSYAEGGNIMVGKKYRMNYGQNEDDSYSILEVVDTNYFSVSYSGGRVVRMRVIESSDNSRVGEYEELSKATIRKLVKNGMLKPLGKYGKGGGVNSGRDAMFKSQQPHEQNYKRKREWKKYKTDGWFGDWFDDGGGVADLSVAAKSFKKLAEELVSNNLENGEICISKLKEILGREPDYPVQIIGTIKLKKVFLKPKYILA